MTRCTCTYAGPDEFGNYDFESVDDCEIHGADARCSEWLTCVVCGRTAAGFSGKVFCAIGHPSAPMVRPCDRLHCNDTIGPCEQCPRAEAQS